MKRILLFLISTLLVFGCVKDQVEQNDLKNEIVTIRSNIDLPNVSNDDYQLLNVVLRDNFTFEQLYNIAEESGRLDLNHSYVLNSSDQRTLSFALMKNNQLGGVLLLIKNGNDLIYQYASMSFLGLDASEKVQLYGKSMSTLIQYSSDVINTSIDSGFNVNLQSYQDIIDEPEVLETTGDCYYTQLSSNYWTSYMIEDSMFGAVEVVSQNTFDIWISCSGGGVDPDMFTEDTSTGGGGGGGNYSGYSTDREDCLKNVDAFERGMLIYELSQYEYPCEEVDVAEVVDDYIDSWCNGSNAGENFPFDAKKIRFLDGVEKIKKPKNFESICPCFNTLLDQMLEADDGNWFCDQVKKMASSKKFHVGFQIVADKEENDVGPILELDPKYRDNSFHTFSSGNKSVILIPRSYCELSATANGIPKEESVKVAAQFLHEFLHAHLYQLHKEHQWSLEELYDEEGKILVGGAYWNELVRKYHNLDPQAQVSPNQHYIFFQYFVDLIAESFYTLNGNVGTVEQYQYYAHLFINTENLSQTVNDILNGEVVEDDIPDWYTNGQELDPKAIDFLEKFDLLKYKENWIGDASFKIKC